MIRDTVKFVSNVFLSLFLSNMAIFCHCGQLFGNMIVSKEVFLQIKDLEIQKNLVPPDEMDGGESSRKKEEEGKRD